MYTDPSDNNTTMTQTKIVSEKQSKPGTSPQKDSPLYKQSDLFLPKKHVSYFVYKPARTLKPDAPFHLKFLNYIQLAYYKYQLATGLYMMNERERALINFLVVASIGLTIYHFVLF